MIRKLVAVIVGFVCGGVSAALVHAVSSLFHPMPEGLDFNDREAMKAFVNGLSPGAFALVFIAHGSASFVAGLVCSLIMRRHWMVGSLILGVLFTAAGVSNLFMIPSPVWFIVVDLLLYLPAALAGGALGGVFGARGERRV